MKTLTRDRALPQAKPTKAQLAERLYARSLRRLASNVGHLITGFGVIDPSTVPSLTQMLRAYAEALTPWAVSTAARMVEQVNQKDLANWKATSAELSKGLLREILTAPTGETMRQLMAEQVTLIKSIPLDAAQRVHDLVIKGVEDGTRAKEIATEIMRSGEVAQSHALLIARTEVSRAQANLTEARAKAIGSTHYVWRTSHDGTVRKDHKRLDGKVFAWNDPPIADERSGARSNPGCIYNCRCFAEPILTES